MNLDYSFIFWFVLDFGFFVKNMWWAGHLTFLSKAVELFIMFFFKLFFFRNNLNGLTAMTATHQVWHLLAYHCCLGIIPRKTRLIRHGVCVLNFLSIFSYFLSKEELTQK
jgi:hypothetical protein